MGKESCLQLLISIVCSLIFTVQATEYQAFFEPKSIQYAEFEDGITGYEFNDYSVNGLAGEIIRVDLTPSHLNNYFNIYLSGENEPIFTGAMNSYYAKLQFAKDSNFFVRVFLAKDTAKHGESSDYKLTIIKHSAENEVANMMHPSWDQDGDGINDCEKEDSCDHTVDYTIARPQKSL